MGFHDEMDGRLRERSHLIDMGFVSSRTMQCPGLYARRYTKDFNGTKFDFDHSSDGYLLTYLDDVYIEKVPAIHIDNPHYITDYIDRVVPKMDMLLVGARARNATYERYKSNVLHLHRGNARPWWKFWS